MKTQQKRPDPRQYLLFDWTPPAPVEPEVFYLPMPLPLSDEPVLAEGTELEEDGVAVDDPRVEWTDWEIRVLREEILNVTLTTMMDPRTSAKHMREEMMWLEDDTMHPFSFVACCLDVNCDPEVVRNDVLRLLRKHDR